MYLHQAKLKMALYRRIRARLLGASVRLCRNTNYNSIQSILSYRRNLLHCCTSSLPALLRNLPAPGCDDVFQFLIKHVLAVYF